MFGGRFEIDPPMATSRPARSLASNARATARRLMVAKASPMPAAVRVDREVPKVLVMMTSAPAAM